MNDNRSVQRCLSLLRAFGQQPRQTLATLSKTVELPHSTVLRFLHTLEREGYVRRDGALWSLGPQMLELGFTALESVGVTAAVQEALQRLAEACSGTVNIGEQNKEAVTILARATSEAERRKLLIVNLRVGSALPQTTALYQALDAPADEWRLAHYPAQRHITIAISMHISDTRALSLGMSVDMNEFPLERVESEVLAMLRQERQYLERLMRMAPV